MRLMVSMTAIKLVINFDKALDELQDSKLAKLTLQ